MTVLGNRRGGGRGASRRLTALLLASGAVAAPAFVAAFTVEGAKRRGYDPLREPVSALALGPRGLTQRINFIATGCLMVAYAAGLRRAATGRSRTGPSLVAAFGIGLIGAGVFVTGPTPSASASLTTTERPTLHAALHDAFGLVVFGALAGACAAFARQFAAAGRRGWALYSGASGLLVALGVGMFGRGFGGAEPLARVGGLVQRLTITIGWGWLMALAVHLLRRRQ